MSLTPPPLRSGSVPATTVATAGMGGAQPLPPHPPAMARFPYRVSGARVGDESSTFPASCVGLRVVG
jgi:hypothetical protein